MEDILKDDFLGFPDECHGHGQREEHQRNEEPETELFHQFSDDAEDAREMGGRANARRAMRMVAKRRSRFMPVNWRVSTRRASSGSMAARRRKTTLRLTRKHRAEKVKTSTMVKKKLFEGARFSQ